MTRSFDFSLLLSYILPYSCSLRSLLQATAVCTSECLNYMYYPMTRPRTRTGAGIYRESPYACRNTQLYANGNARFRARHSPFPAVTLTAHATRTYDDTPWSGSALVHSIGRTEPAHIAHMCAASHLRSQPLACSLLGLGLRTNRAANILAGEKRSSSVERLKPRRLDHCLSRRLDAPWSLQAPAAPRNPPAHLAPSNSGPCLALNGVCDVRLQSPEVAAW